MRKNLALLLCLFWLTGCAPVPASPTALPQSTVTPAATPLPELPPTATPGTGLAQQCLSLSDQKVSLKEVASETVLLESVPGSLYLLQNVQTGLRYKIPSESEQPTWVSAPEVSPDGSMLAIMELVLNAQHKPMVDILWVVDAHANVLMKISFDQVYLGPVRWLDNEQLIIYKTNDYGALLLLNLSTRAQQDISNELPMLDNTVESWAPWWRVEYSPDLEWVAYFYNDYGLRGTIVRDLVTKQNLWQSTSGDSGVPVWAPDGQQIAVVGKGQLYLVNRAGKAKPILGGDHASVPSWSPDGHYLAFWNADRLMIYDVQADWVLDPCVVNSDSPQHSPPNWSPDSQQMIVNTETIAEVVIVDLRKNTAFKLRSEPDVAHPVRWMKSLP